MQQIWKKWRSDFLDFENLYHRLWMPKDDSPRCAMQGRGGDGRSCGTLQLATLATLYTPPTHIITMGKCVFPPFLAMRVRVRVRVREGEHVHAGNLPGNLKGERNT